MNSLIFGASPPVRHGTAVQRSQASNHAGDDSNTWSHTGCQYPVACSNAPFCRVRCSVTSAIADTPRCAARLDGQTLTLQVKCCMFGNAESTGNSLRHRSLPRNGVALLGVANTGGDSGRACCGG